MPDGIICQSQNQIILSSIDHGIAALNDAVKARLHFNAFEDTDSYLAFAKRSVQCCRRTDQNL